MRYDIYMSLGAKGLILPMLLRSLSWNVPHNAWNKLTRSASNFVSRRSASSNFDPRNRLP